MENVVIALLLLCFLRCGFKLQSLKRSDLVSLPQAQFVKTDLIPTLVEWCTNLFSTVTCYTISFISNNARRQTLQLWITDCEWIVGSLLASQETSASHCSLAELWTHQHQRVVAMQSVDLSSLKGIGGQLQYDAVFQSTACAHFQSVHGLLSAHFGLWWLSSNVCSITRYGERPDQNLSERRTELKPVLPISRLNCIAIMRGDCYAILKLISNASQLISSFVFIVLHFILVTR